ncbi:MAG: cupin domain-containing protein [Bacteroidota bacterium]|nr:cupin domain-containing protein [Bacteroidota bacterium]
MSLSKEKSRGSDEKNITTTNMKANNKILDMTQLGMKFTVLKNGTDTDGKSLDLHWELFPGCNMKDPLVHIHPNAIETYEILEGEMEFFVKDKWLPAKKGEKLTVPIGVTHAFRNPTDKIVTVYNTHQPALKMEEYFEDVCKVLDKVTGNRTKDFKMNLKAKLYLGVLMSNYRNDIIAINPPDFAVKVLGYIGKLIGVKY